MDPYHFVAEATSNGESLLSLCCGIGLELRSLSTPDITGVDIAPQYLEELTNWVPRAKTVCSDALGYIKAQPTDSVDVISIIDGIEHMEKLVGKEVISHMKRVCRKKIVLFFPQGQQADGYLKNEPHDAWGISGADEHQTHKSGWTLKELERSGFRLMQSAESTSQHGEPYTALMMLWEKK